MKNRFLELKKNNRGSSLIVAIVAVGFVGILATVILSSAVTNYQLKIMDNQAKKTFYSAETALQEIYAGLGSVCYSQLENSYSDVVTNLLTQVNTNGTVYYVQMSNEEANSRLKSEYLSGMKTYFPSVEDAAEYLTTLIQNQDNAYVKNISGITYEESTGSLTLEDAQVFYKQSKNDIYQTVTVDIVISYPDILVDFTSGTANNLATYLEYCLVGMNGVNFGYTTNGVDTRSTSTVSGNLFAGEGGIQVTSGSQVEFQDLIPFDDSINTTIVTSGDLNVVGGTTQSTLNIGSVNLWCNNINVGTASENSIAILNYLTSEDSSTYVADDLNIQGDQCQVTLGSSYYGFGYQGSLLDASYSSAIVVNGKDTVLNTITLKNLLLAGRAYLDFGDAANTSDYLTADSLALKGNQEIYLVPTKYMSSTSAVEATNPLEVNPKATESPIQIDLTGFFPYDLGLLNTSDPYVVKETKTNTFYLYLNFKDKDAMVTYVNLVMDLEQLKTLAGASYQAAYEEDWKNLNLVIEKSINKFVASGSVGLNYDSSTSIYSNGAMYEVGSQGMSIDNTNGLSTDTVLNMCLDKSNRYEILKSFLTDIGGGDSVLTIPSSLNIAGVDYPTQNMGTTDIYQRAVDVTMLSNLTQNYEKITDTTIATVVTDKDGKTSSGKYTIPATITGGVVLAYNVNVYVTSGFEGLILTNKEIFVTGSGNLITTGTTDKASQILDADTNIGKYFYAFKLQSGSDSGLSQITVKDLLNFNNWRKNNENS